MAARLARHAGSCYGVQRALDLANGLLEEGRSASTLGPLIHNPIVVAELADNGIAPVDDIDAIETQTVIVRSHGISPELSDELAARGFDVIDATCPHVARAQLGAASLAKDGCHVLVVGEAGHPEVEALVAYARRNGADVDVVSSPSDIPSGLGERVGVVVQTTQTEGMLDQVLSELDRMGIVPTVRNTICSATQDRQEAAAELARTVDAMVVIGGKNSSNTTRLAEICAQECPITLHIEPPDELDMALLGECGSVGVTAGASTPEDQIEVVMERLGASS